MSQSPESSFAAFIGPRLVAAGTLGEVAREVKAALDQGAVANRTRCEISPADGAPAARRLCLSCV